MVDIPTLNKSVNEFRALIQSNNERTQRAEERKKKADLDAQKKLANTLKEVEEKLGDLPAAQRKANLELKASQEKLDALSIKHPHLNIYSALDVIVTDKKDKMCGKGKHIHI